MIDQIVKALVSPDGKYRVDIFRRDDGLFGFRQMAHYERPEGDYWAPLGPYGTIADTPERAEHEARGSVSWLVEL